MLIERIRATQPMVLNYANTVTQQRVADSISMLGGSPLMTQALPEIEELVAASQAVVINLGTWNAAGMELMLQLGKSANVQGVPVVLDPVGVGLPQRSQMVQQLLQAVQFTVIRGNAAEIAWFAQVKGQGKGIDAAQDVAVDGTIAQQASERTGAVILQSGPVDVIADRDHWVTQTRSNPMLAQNVGMGDVLSSLTGCFLAVAEDSFQAAVAAAQCMAVAGARASQRIGQHPGQLPACLLDELSWIDDAALDLA